MDVMPHDKTGVCGLRGGRRGAVTLYAVLALVASLAILALVVNLLQVNGTQLELQTSAQAGALAAAGAFLDDALLLGDPAVVVERWTAAQLAARAQAALNSVRGRPFVLQLNPGNLPTGDVLLGYLETPRSQNFVTNEIDPSAPDPLIVTFNALRVRADQSAARGNSVGFFMGPLLGQAAVDVRDASTALIDRDVVGFRPWGTPNVPLVPLALLSDPAGADARSWEHQVELLQGADAVRFDAVTRTFTPGSDGLHEMELRIALTPGHLPAANVAFLDLGAATGSHFADQVTQGVSAADLAGYGGQIMLDDAQQAYLPGEELGPPEGSGDLALLRTALENLRLRGEARVFPLFSGFDGGTGAVIVTGFVAARVVDVGDVVPGQPLRVVVQPAVLCTSTALTDAARRQAGTARMNPYVCKIRVVE